MMLALLVSAAIGAPVNDGRLAMLEQGTPKTRLIAEKIRLRQAPDDPSRVAKWGVALAEYGRCGDALDVLHEVLADDPDLPEAWMAAAECSRRIGLSSDGLDFLRRGRRLDPDHEGMRQLEQYYLAATNGWQQGEGLSDFEDEFEPVCHLTRAAILAQQGDVEGYDRERALCLQGGRSVWAFWRLDAQMWLVVDDPIAVLHTVGPVRRGRGPSRPIFAEAQRRLGDLEGARTLLEHSEVEVSEGLRHDAVMARIREDLGQETAAQEILHRYGPSELEVLEIARKYADELQCP